MALVAKARIALSHSHPHASLETLFGESMKIAVAQWEKANARRDGEASAGEAAEGGLASDPRGGQAGPSGRGTVHGAHSSPPTGAAVTPRIDWSCIIGYPSARAVVPPSITSGSRARITTITSPGPTSAMRTRVRISFGRRGGRTAAGRASCGGTGVRAHVADGEGAAGLPGRLRPERCQTWLWISSASPARAGSGTRACVGAARRARVASGMTPPSGVASPLGGCPGRPRRSPTRRARRRARSRSAARDRGRGPRRRRRPGARAASVPPLARLVEEDRAVDGDVAVDERARDALEERVVDPRAEESSFSSFSILR